MADSYFACVVVEEKREMYPDLLSSNYGVSIRIGRGIKERDA
jgi:hypothetical protein